MTVAKVKSCIKRLNDSPKCPLDFKARDTKKMKLAINGKVIKVVPISTTFPPLPFKSTRSPPMKRNMEDLDKGPINMDIIASMEMGNFMEGGGTGS